MYKIYLVAQPNSGKTTLFNRITNQQCYVANWPGKTVEVFQAKIEHHGKEIQLIDLPGINSFKTLSKEEEITKEFIFGDEKGVAILIVNGESLYRSFYFAVQVLEMKSDVVLAINKLDSLEKRGIHINPEILNKRLGIDVVLISALHGTGINQLMDRCMDILESRIRNKKLKINYGNIESFIERLEKIIGDRGTAIRALEGDEMVLSSLSEKMRSEVEFIAKEIASTYGNPEEIIITHRYKFVEEVLSSSVREVKISKVYIEEKLDRLFFSKFGFFISLLILFFALFISFSINTGFPLNLMVEFMGFRDFADIIEGYSLVGIISMFFDSISSILDENLPESFLTNLLIGGIIPGVGIVASFFPLILVLNFVMSLIEDSGLMARIAVSMDRFFSFFALTGKSVFPFSISLACNVPGVATSRVLETDSERLRVALASPFVICQARLLVLVLFVTFMITSPLIQSATIILIYLLSVFLFLGATKIYSKVIKREISELLMELPPYHFPNLKVSWWITWTRSKAFITKVGKIILLISIIIWLLEFFEITKILGSLIAKIFSPFGFESAELGFALLMGFLAKEVIISSLAISFGTSDISEIISKLGITFDQTIALIIFISFYTPCVATISAIHTEIRSYRLLALSIAFQLFVAYNLAFLVYKIMNLI
ncbi:MAG: ferrous iron transport protein B [Archaeoglobaceae archaeon]|nr:ferrous iron transport protein B [Archaeoglobaceae archaeon]MDW7989491.1 ferrous iron transport protein B [Archaeoglobaceae archaeon]